MTLTITIGLHSLKTLPINCKYMHLPQWHSGTQKWQDRGTDCDKEQYEEFPIAIKIDLQHVIGHVLSKSKLLIRNLGLGILGAFNNDLWLLPITTTLKHQQRQKKLE